LRNMGEESVCLAVCPVTGACAPGTKFESRWDVSLTDLSEGRFMKRSLLSYLPVSLAAVAATGRCRGLHR
jgi:hypothetical protein